MRNTRKRVHERRKRIWDAVKSNEALSQSAKEISRFSLGISLLNLCILAFLILHYV